MRTLLDGAIELPLDKYRIRIDELEEACAKAEEERDKAKEENAVLKQRLQELQW